MFHGQKKLIKTLDVIFDNETWKLWNIFTIKVRVHSSFYNQLFQNWNSLI